MVFNYLHYVYNIPVIAPLSGVFHIRLSPSLDRVVIFKAITTCLLGLYCFMGAQNFYCFQQAPADSNIYWFIINWEFVRFANVLIVGIMECEKIFKSNYPVTLTILKLISF